MEIATAVLWLISRRIITRLESRFHESLSSKVSTTVWIRSTILWALCCCFLIQSRLMQCVCLKCKIEMLAVQLTKAGKREKRQNIGFGILQKSILNTKEKSVLWVEKKSFVSLVSLSILFEILTTHTRHFRSLDEETSPYSLYRALFYAKQRIKASVSTAGFTVAKKCFHLSLGNELWIFI